MTWEWLQAFLEFWMIAGILWLDWLIWQDGRKSLELYQTYFRERTAWYKARGKNGKVGAGSVAADSAVSVPSGGSSTEVAASEPSSTLAVPVGEGGNL